MRVEVEGPPPAWPLAHDGAALRARLAAGAPAREPSRALDRSVEVLRMCRSGDLLGSVRDGGQTGHRHQTLVRARPGGTWTSNCSCKSARDCTHAVAVLLTARDWLARREAATQAGLTATQLVREAAPPAWETALRDLVRPAEQPVRTGSPLGLRVELTTGGPSRRVRLRPVTARAPGRWVTSGVSFRDLDGRYRATSVDERHREAVLALLPAWRVGQPPWSSTPQAHLHLDELGRGAWQLLEEATAAGVELVSAQPGQRVVLGGVAQLVLDLQRPADGADVRLVPQVLLADGGLVPDPLLLGEPVTGLAVQTPGALHLAPLNRPLDGASLGLLRSGALVVPADDLPRFLGRYYPALRQRFTVTSEDGSVVLPEVVPPHLALSVALGPAHHCELRWSYGYQIGDDVVHVPLATPAGVVAEVVRDIAAERALAHPQDPSLVDRDLAGVDTARFVTEVLPALTARGVRVTVTGEAVAYAESDALPQIVVATSDTDATDWFDLSVEVRVGEEQVPLAHLLSALTLGQEHMLLDSGTWFRLDRPELAALARVLAEARALADADGGLRLTPYQAGMWEELVELGVVARQSERWQQTVGGLLALDALPRPEPPVGLKAELRPYQQDGFAWLSLLWDARLGGVLADDMGLGKTLQTLAMAVRAREQGTLGGDAGPLLVVAPTSVVATWLREAARFAPDLACVALTETRRRSGVPLPAAVQGADLVITSYALLRLDAEAFREVRWSGLVLDEAQAVKNRQAKTYAAARRLGAPFTLVVTGTPLENSLMDLWSLLSLAAPGLFPDPERFAEDYRQPIESGTDPERLAALRRRIRPLMLRRTKEAVAPELPPKVEQVLSVTLDPAHRRVYDRHLQRERQRVLGLLDDPRRNRIAILSALTKMRQLSLAAVLVDDAHEGVPSSKLDVLLDRLVEVVAEGHRVLVFSQFTRFLALARARLRAAGLPHAYLDGRTRDRPARIAEFTSGAAPVFLISLKAGGIGLTLVEADHVFVLDPWWNPATEEQAIDRAHRIGQDKTVFVTRLVAADTVEEKVVALQARKRDLFDRVVDEGGLLGAALTVDDVRGLFA